MLQLKSLHLLKEMTRNIVAGMNEHNVERIIYTASAGIDREIPGFIGKMAMWMLKNPLIDHRSAADTILENGLNCTIVRPMGLTNHPFTGKYRESAAGAPEKPKSIPRADVAHFILKALSNPCYEHASIGISS